MRANKEKRVDSCSVVNNFLFDLWAEAKRDYFL